MAREPPRATVPPRARKPDPTPLQTHQTIEAVGLTQQKLIGRVIVEWTMLENKLGELVWRLAGMNFEEGRIFVEKMDASRAIQILRVLGIRYLEGVSSQQLINALTTAEQLRLDRNFIVHGTWATIQPEGHPTASSLREKSEPGQVVAEHFPRSRMLAIAKAIRGTRDMFTRLLHEQLLPY